MMKIFLLPIIAIAFLTSCNVKPKTKLTAPENIKGLVYGDSVKNDNVIDLTAVSTAMGDETKLDLKVKGTVEEVFTVKHCCRMSMKLSNGELMLITFKDSTVIVPKTLKGKEVILDGFAYLDTLSIDDQKENARNAGKAATEIANITTPKRQLLYSVKGLVVL